MGWFRGQRQLGAWLALVALALQLGLSLGHIHVEAAGHAPELAAAAPGGPQESHQEADQETHRDSHQDHGGAADRDYCPSCAILSLLAGAQIGATAASAVPVRLGFEELVPAAGTSRPASIRAAFRARAPPSA